MTYAAAWRTERQFCLACGEPVALHSRGPEHTRQRPGTPRALSGRRGLCQTCYRKPEVRAKYPARYKHEPERLDDPPLPPRPTEAKPGTWQKMLVLEHRLEDKYSLFHPDDERLKPGDRTAKVDLTKVRLLHLCELRRLSAPPEGARPCPGGETA
ncbi:MAG: hypothetical protein KGL39_10625 [Patescibacteria group bacterium]|nr:hypothetical protein [Patescibacteria group bacterium]